MSEKKSKRGRPRSFDREKALHSAIELFLEKGFEGTSVDDLTDKLGITKPSLYCSFGNKEEIFIEAIKKYYGYYETFFKTLQEEELTLQQSLKKWMDFFLTNFEKQECNEGCLIVNSTLLCKEDFDKIAGQIKDFHLKNESLMTEHLNVAKSKGELPFDTDTTALSQFLNSTVQGMAVLRRAQGSMHGLRNIAKIALNSIHSLNLRISNTKIDDI